MSVTYLTICILLFNGCGKPTPTIPLANTPLPTATPTLQGALSGQVFIVTEGAQNLPLGLVDINIYPEDAIAKHVTARQKLVDKTRDALERRLNDQEATVVNDNTSNPLSELAVGTAALSKAAYSMNPNEKNLEIWQDAVNSVNAIDQTKRNHALLRDVYKSDLDNWPTADFFFYDLPQPLITTKTDADGRFTVQLQQNTQYVIAAHSSRKVGEKEETYYWLVKVFLAGESNATLLLANDNLITSGAKDSVITTSANSLEVPLPSEQIAESKVVGTETDSTIIGLVKLARPIESAKVYLYSQETGTYIAALAVKEAAHLKYSSTLPGTKRSIEFIFDQVSQVAPVAASMTQNNGMFRLDNLTGGDYFLCASVEADSAAALWVKPIHVNASSVVLMEPDMDKYSASFSFP